MKEKIAKAALLVGCQVVSCNAVYSWDGCSQAALRPDKKKEQITRLPHIRIAQADADWGSSSDVPVGEPMDASNDSGSSRTFAPGRKHYRGKKHIHRGKHKYQRAKNTGIKEASESSSDSCCASSMPI